MVRRPAVYELLDETSLAEVLELAGGILPTAALRHIEVQRVEAHEKRTMLTLDLTFDHGSGRRSNQQLQAFKIRDGDQVHIFPDRRLQRRCDLSAGTRTASGALFLQAGNEVDGPDFVLWRPAAGAGAALRGNRPPECAGLSSQRRELRYLRGAGQPGFRSGAEASRHGANLQPLRLRASARRVGRR